jgi:hypothetical protein
VGKRGRARSLVVYRDLARAVRRESAQAVAHWWGVTPQTVTKWRKALDVGPVTAGTRRLKRETALGPAVAAAREKAYAVIRDPEKNAARREKIAQAKRGKPRARPVIEAMRQGRTGKPHDDEARRKMSAAHKARGTLVPGTKLWTAEEDDLVRRLAAGEAAARTGRSLIAVYSRRRELGVPDRRRRPGGCRPQPGR